MINLLAAIQFDPHIRGILVVLVGVGVREGDSLRLHFEGPFPVPDTGDLQEDLRLHTEQITAALEKWIRRHPDQWMWLHRRWKVQPPPAA